MDPLALNTLMSPKSLALSSANQQFKVDIKATVAKINFTNGSVTQQIRCFATMTVKAFSGFHKDPAFYTMILNTAQSKLRTLPPYRIYKEKGHISSFEKPEITYTVVEGKSLEKVWVQFPLTDSIAISTPPSILQVPNHTPHAQFYIDFELAVNAPQPVAEQPKPFTPRPTEVVPPLAEKQVDMSPPAPAPTPAAATAATAATAHTEVPAKKKKFESEKPKPIPPPPTWPVGADKMVEQITDLALKYSVFSPMLVNNKLSRIFHAFRRNVDPAFKRYDSQQVLNIKHSYGMATSPPTPLKKTPKLPERLWRLDSLSEDAISQVSQEGDEEDDEEDEDEDFHNNKNVDARKLLDWKSGNRGRCARSGDRDPDRSYGQYRQHGRQDRPYDRSSSRGPERQHLDRRDAGFQQPQRGNRRRGPYRK